MKNTVKVCVHARMQNRTALGIFHAYIKLNPEVGIRDLKMVFPNTLNPDSGVSEIFVPSNQKGNNEKWKGYFFEDEAYLHLSDGSELAVVSMWTKPSLERLQKHAEKYGITTFKEENKDCLDNKSKFSLEYLNGFVPKEIVARTNNEEGTTKAKRKVYFYVVAIVALGMLLYLLL